MPQARRPIHPADAPSPGAGLGVGAAKPPPDWRLLPKVLLHEHLDGGLRPQTLLELCAERGLRAPAHDAEGLVAWMRAHAHAGSLTNYLQGFSLTVAAMATLKACERVAFEAAEDARLDGCVLAEFRIAPLLFEAFGLEGDDVIDALLAGLRRSTLPCGLIVCALRTETPQHTARSARLAARHAGRGVIGFDLAGDEQGFPPAPHAGAFALARQAGLGLTCHAGEADHGGRVFEAAALGATRIGHGVRLMDLDVVDVQVEKAGPRTHADPPPPLRLAERVALARSLGLHFEVCPSSNVHTGVVASLAVHPIKAMLAAGLSVSISTDNRLISGVSLSDQCEALHRQAGLSPAQMMQAMCAAAQASFMPAPSRDAALAALARGWAPPVSWGCCRR